MKLIILLVLILLLLLLLLILINIIKLSFFENFNNSEIFEKYKILNNNLYFIHIPKNAGTYFCKYFLENKNKEPGHSKIIDYPSNLHNRTVAIVRNPYDRMVSIYTYSKIGNKGHYYKPNIKHEHYSFSKNNNFDKFVTSLYKKNIKHDIHSVKQSDYIIINNKCPCKYVLRLENLERDLKDKLGFKNIKNIKNKKENQSNTINWKKYYTNDTTKKMVYEMYKDDFINFNYSKNIN